MPGGTQGTDAARKAALGRHERALQDIFEEERVPTEVIDWLATNGITAVASFADLAANRSEVKTNIATPAGLDARQPLAVQPVLTAWRRADAIATANLEERARGHDPDTGASVSAPERARIDMTFRDHYKFKFPESLQPSDALLGRLIRFFARRSRYVPKITEAQSILERGSGPTTHGADRVTLSFARTATGSLQGQIEEQQFEAVSGLWKLRQRHFQLMVAYAEACGPTYAEAPLTELLEYHEFIMGKATDGDVAQRPTLEALIRADFEMRSKWMISYIQHEHATFVAGLTHHRTHSAYLFTALNPTRTNTGGGGLGTKGGKGGKGTGVIRPRMRVRQRTRSTTVTVDNRLRPQQTGKGKGGKGRGNGRSRSTRRTGGAQWGDNGGWDQSLQTQTQDQTPICRFYNTNSCRNGDSCPFAHVCNYPGCRARHARVGNH